MTERRAGPTGRTAAASVLLPEYAAGTRLEVLEAQRSSTVDRIVVSQGVPLGPRGLMGPTGPTGPRGFSSQWIVGDLDVEDGMPPTDPAQEWDEEKGGLWPPVGTVWVQPDTGKAWVLELVEDPQTGVDVAVWRFWGYVMGPTGPSGPSGPPASFEVLNVHSVDTFPETDVDVVPVGETGSGRWGFVFHVPHGPTGPAGPFPVLVGGDAHTMPYPEQPRVDLTLVGGSSGEYVVEWWLPQGEPGRPGVSFDLKGRLLFPGPPTRTNPPDDAAGNPAVGDAWLGTDNHVWVWTAWGVAGDPDWVDIGVIAGLVGPTGPRGEAMRSLQFDVTVPSASVDDGFSRIRIDHTFPNGAYPFDVEYPSVRLLLAEAVDVWREYRAFSVYYPSKTEIVVEVDGSYAGSACRVVLT